MTTPQQRTAPRTAAERRYYALYDATGGDFPTLDQFLAIEAEAAEQSGPLDVGRLAEAARVVFGGKPPGWEVSVTAPYQQRADSAFQHLANDLAAEYARHIPQPAQPADTALREALAEALRGDRLSDSDYFCPPLAPDSDPTGPRRLMTVDEWAGVLVERMGLASQPSSSEPDR